MKQILSLFMVFVLFVTFQAPAFAKTTQLEVVPLSKDIDLAVYSYKKTKNYVAVELGFTNKSKKAVAFNADKIILNDREKYSVEPIPYEDLQSLLNGYQRDRSWVPMALMTVFGVAGIAASSGSGTFSRAVTIAALSLGGVFVVSSILKSMADNKKLITFENNSITQIKKIPANTTLGGFLYFPRVKKPTSLSLDMKGVKKGETDRKNFSLKKVPATKKSENIKTVKNVMAPYATPGYADGIPQSYPLPE